MLKSALALTASFVLLMISPITANACPQGNPSSLAYIRRDNNRCEGLNDRPISVGDTFDLISFVTTSLTSYPERLSIRVPGTGSSTPNILVQSYFRSYLLDNLSLQPSSGGHSFSLGTTVLQRASIPLTSLRATATINRNGQIIYYPVVFGQPSGRYLFVIESPQRTTFPTLEIRRNGQRVFQSPITIPRSGQIPITWNYGNAPNGLYELYIVDGTEQRRSFRFEHNRRWF